MRRNQPTFAALQRQHDENNLASARRIARDPAPYGGPGSGLHCWALAVLERLAPGEARQLELPMVEAELD